MPLPTPFATPLTLRALVWRPTSERERVSSTESLTAFPRQSELRFDANIKMMYSVLIDNAGYHRSVHRLDRHCARCLCLPRWSARVRKLTTLVVKKNTHSDILFLVSCFKQIQDLNPYAKDKGWKGGVSSFAAVTVARSVIMPYEKKLRVFVCIQSLFFRFNYPFDTVRRRMMLQSEKPVAERLYKVRRMF